MKLLTRRGATRSTHRVGVDRPPWRLAESVDQGANPMTSITNSNSPGRVVVLTLPVRGTWLVGNSPAQRVPSHGTHLFATTYAMDLVAVEAGRTSATRDWRTLVATEPPDNFVAFGRPVLAPATGTVLAIHDGEIDHEARRSALARIPYALTQARRARGGPGALAGNHVTIRCARGRHVLLAHLRAGSIRVRPGEPVTAGQEVAACGNSGNSTQPHVHLQAMDSADPSTAHGLPLALSRYQVWPRHHGRPIVVDEGVPNNGDIIEPV